MKRILCYGDSNTWGFTPATGKRYAPDVRWPGVMQSTLGADYAVWEDPFAPCRNGLEGIGYGLLRAKPLDLVVLMLGTNDLLQGASPSEIAARMDAFLSRLSPHCKNILLVAPPPMKRGSWVSNGELAAASIRLGEEYKALAQKRKIPFADTRGWNIDLTFDGVHFTEAGHHRFAEKLCERFHVF